MEQAASKQLVSHVVWDSQLFLYKDNYPEDVPSSLRVKFIEPFRFPVFGSLAGKFRLRCVVYKWLKENSNDYDFVLLRYTTADPMLCLVAKRIPNVLTVHHTKEEEELNLLPFPKGVIKSMVEWLFSRYVLKRVKGVVAVTSELARYEQKRIGRNIPTFLYPNGVILNFEANPDDYRGGCLKLVFVADSAKPWHGLDLLLERVNVETDFELHIVGELGLSIRSYNNNPNIIIHGKLSNQDLNIVLAHMDVGISSMGLFRKKMTEACPLKSRRYLLQGLAVYGHYVDPCFNENFPFYRNGGANFQEIRKFGLEMRNYSRADITGRALPYIEKGQLMANLANELACLNQV